MRNILEHLLDVFTFFLGQTHHFLNCPPVGLPIQIPENLVEPRIDIDTCQELTQNIVVFVLMILGIIGAGIAITIATQN